MQNNNFHTSLIRLVALIVSGKSLKDPIVTGHAFDSFLKFYVPDRLHTDYRDRFNSFVAEYASEGKLKKISSNSVRIIRICSDINTRYNKRTKMLFLMHLTQILYPYAQSDAEVNDYIKLASASMNIDDHILSVMLEFISGSMTEISNDICKEVLPGLHCLYLAESEIILIFTSQSDYYLNDRKFDKGNVTEFAPGMHIARQGEDPVYFSDIKRVFDIADSQEFSLHVNELSYSVQGKIVLQPVSFSVSKGEFVAILGKSGTGKSTLIRMLAGELKASTGHFFIKKEKEPAFPAIGIVHQDEFFIPEFTVYELLLERMKLLQASGKADRKQGTSSVIEVMEQTGLSTIASQVAGTPEKTQLSGGQRKRLAIALCLLQHPEIMLVDEPTSGLSSADAREIMGLLRNIASCGKTVICPIHQPSYEYLHYTDQSLILDEGGFPVYFGKTDAAAVYLRLHAGITDSRATACSGCNRFDPDDLFSIISENTIDEFGKETNVRKIAPETWHEIFRKSVVSNYEKPLSQLPLKRKTHKINYFCLFAHYLIRDVKRRLKNPIPLVLLLLITAALGTLTGVICHSGEVVYFYGDNPNIPAGFLMMIITALFTGMIMAGNEIRGDVNFRKNEMRFSGKQGLWLLTKLLRMLLLSLALSVILVTITFLLFAAPLNYALHIVLFMLIFFNGAAMGLILSALLPRLSQVYFCVPLLVVPQLILSGVVIDFNNYPSFLKNNKYVPAIAEVAVSRWAFEAIAVNAFVNNDYEKLLYRAHFQQHEAAYYTNYFLPQLEEIAAHDKDKAAKLLASEWFANANFPKLKADVNTQISFLKQYYSHRMNEIYTEQQTMFEQLNKVYDLKELRRKNNNLFLEKMLTAPQQGHSLVVTESMILRKYSPVFDLPENAGGRAHFYAPAKRLGTKYMDTFIFNSLVISCINIILGLLLVVFGILHSHRLKAL